MKSSWNLFWKDCGTLFGDYLRFCRKHWFGCLLYIIGMIVYMAACTTGAIDVIYDAIYNMFRNLTDTVKSIFVRGKHEKK